MSNKIYEASVYSKKLSYRNFKGEDRDVVLYFALDPMELMQTIANFAPKKVKSGNPARNGVDADISDADQLTFVRKLAIKSAGSPSEDGENWEPFEDFDNTLAGKAFLTRLISSDGDRRDFAEKVIMNPFRAFVDFAREDPSNTPKDIQQFDVMLGQMEKIFTVPAPGEDPAESIEDKRARLAAELALMDENA